MTRGGGRALAWCLLLGLAACGPSEPPGPVGSAPGERAPPLEGRTPAGERFSLASLRPPVVLVFYESGGCGLCRVRLQRLQESLPAYRRLEAAVVAVTAEQAAAIRSTVRAVGVEVPVVGVDTATLARWGARDPVSGRPLPASFVLDERGVVRFRHVGRNAGDGASDAALLATLEELRGAGAAR